jgi:hypothetical protein
MKIAVRSDGARPEPMLKKPPLFSAYCKRTVSPRKERSVAPGRDVMAMRFVMRSHPTVAATSARSKRILAGVFIIGRTIVAYESAD